MRTSRYRGERSRSENPAGGAGFGFAGSCLFCPAFPEEAGAELVLLVPSDQRLSSFHQRSVFVKLFLVLVAFTSAEGASFFTPEKTIERPTTITTRNTRNMAILPKPMY